ncbi:MAG: hypothetical protein IID45_03445 [Planctomycetes bacterium]|nr:hypothetical protein [Planctomycetota bacterium]
MPTLAVVEVNIKKYVPYFVLVIGERFHPHPGGQTIGDRWNRPTGWVAVGQRLSALH